MRMNILALLSTCMEVPISLSCLLVHEPPYQIIVCCNSIFRLGSSRMDPCTVFYVTVGLTEARPTIILSCSSILIYLSTTNVRSQVVKNGIYLSMHLKTLNGYIFCSYP